MNNLIDTLKELLGTSKNIIPNKIYLTLGLGLNEDVIQNLTTFQKIQRNDILDEFGYDLLKDSKEKAIAFISARIIDNNSDLIIGNAVSDLSDILAINKIIKKATQLMENLQ